MEPPRGSGRTAPTRRDELVFSAKVTTPRGHQLDLRQRVDGGVLRIGESSIELAAMEFGLLQLLVERRRTVTDPELAYVAWHEIADALSFRSVQADSENVRELVHRVRRKLGERARRRLDREQARRRLSPRRRTRLAANRRDARLARCRRCRRSSLVVGTPRLVVAARCGGPSALRRLGLAWQNALEIARAGRLTAPYGAPFEVVHEERVVPAAPLRAHARCRRRADRGTAAARPAADGRVGGLRHLARRQRGRVPVARGRRRLARRLRRARARGGRHEPHARRSRARGLRRDRSRARGDRPRRPPRRLLAGRHVLLPGRRVPRSAGLASIITIGSPVDLHRTLQRRRGHHRAPGRRPARRARVAARAHRGPARLLHVDRLQAAVGAQGGACSSSTS